MVKKKGQVWVETVIYTLIAFVMIGVVLSFAKPKIEEFQDKAVIEQSIEIMKNIDAVIEEVKYYGAGNQRSIEINLKKGTLKISGINDDIVFEIESRYQYSEPGSAYSEGDLDILTTKKGDLNIVELSRDYSSGYDITYQQVNNLKTFSKASTAYEVIISNNGLNGDKTKIDFEVK